VCARGRSNLKFPHGTYETWNAGSLCYRDDLLCAQQPAGFAQIHVEDIPSAKTYGVNRIAQGLNGLIEPDGSAHGGTHLGVPG
jgi:hypothetical protein